MFYLIEDINSFSTLWGRHNYFCEAVKTQTQVPAALCDGVNPLMCLLKIIHPCVQGVTNRDALPPALPETNSIKGNRKEHMCLWLTVIGVMYGSVQDMEL